MKQTIKDKKEFLAATFGGVFSAGFAIAIIDTQEIIGGIVDSARDMVSNIMGFVVNNFIFRILEGLSDLIVESMIEPVGDLIMAIFQFPISLITSFAEGASEAIGGLFGMNLTGATAQTGGSMVQGVPGIGWAIIGMAVAGAGVAIITGTDVPIAGRIGGGVGSIFVISGAMIGIWGFFPDLSQWILGGVFFIIFGTVALTYIQTVRSITSRSSSPGGA